MITISLNNEQITLPPDTPLNIALEQWGFGEGKVAVAINGEFVPRSRYAEQRLVENDEVDVVKPVGGG